MKKKFQVDSTRDTAINDRQPADGEIFEETPERISRSAKKRAMSVLQDLAAELVELNAGDLAKLPLEDDVRAEIEAVRSIKSHGARRRQLRFLGQYLAEVDVEPITRALAARHKRGKS